MIAISLMVSGALVVYFFGALMAGLQGDELLTVFFRVILIAFSCGALTDLLWGRTNLDAIYPVLYPGGVFLAIFVFVMRITLIGDYFQVGRIWVLESSETVLEFGRNRGIQRVLHAETEDALGVIALMSIGEWRGLTDSALGRFP